jgi:hypothetical protein
MQKPDGLRRLLLATVPGLKANPERLAMFVDKGRVASSASGTLSFEYRYTLAIVVEDYAGDVDAITIPILAWISEQQPELLKAGDQEPFDFEAEIQDGATADVSISIELTERVRVTPRPGGGYDVQHVDEAPIADLDLFPGVCDQNLWQLFLRDELIAQTTDPAFHPPAP